MPIIKISVNDEAYQELQQRALDNHQSIQDYIRSVLFGSTIFTVDEAVRRIQSGNFDDPELYPSGFELPDVYGDEWTIPRGPAGVLGKAFFNYINDNPDLGIKFKDMGKYGRRAVYTYHRGGENK